MFYVDVTMFQEDMIPGSAKVEWKKLGLELKVEYAKLQAIERDVTPGDVLVKCTDMLAKWQEESGKTEDLIKALEGCQLMAQAAVVKQGWFIVLQIQT